MVATSFNGTKAIRREDSFQDTVSVGEWNSISNGGEIYVFDVDLSGVKTAMADNKNMKVRPAATFAKYRTLKNCQVPFKMYAFPTGSGNNADVGNPAALLAAQDEIFINAFGGQTRAYAAGLTGGGTVTAPEIDEGDMDSTPDYGWVFHYDDSAGLGRPVAYSTVTDGGGGSDDTLNLLTGFETLALHDDDVLYACVTYEPQWDIMGDYGNAAHYTHAEFYDMEDAEDLYEIRGVKYNIGQITITAGEPIEFECVAMAATFTETEDLSAVSLGTPEGSPGKVAGQGVATNCHIADVGGNIYDDTTQFWDTITITIGVEYEARMGPNAQNGVHGFHPSVSSYDSTTVEITVPYDNAWLTDYRNGQNKHMLIQIGDLPADSRFFYFANLSWDDEPERTDVGGRSAMILRFRAQETTTALPGNSDAEDNRVRAKFVIGRVA